MDAALRTMSQLNALSAVQQGQLKRCFEQVKRSCASRRGLPFNMNATATINAVRMLKDTRCRGLLVEGWERKDRSDTSALFSKKLDERANAPFKFKPLGY